MNDELSLQTIESGLAIAREPTEVLDEAHRAAAALKRVIDAKPNKVMFGGHQYLEFEDWQTVGRFYGIAPRIVGTCAITVGDFTGWEASAEAVHVPSGRVVSSADAMCMSDEEKWSSRPKYEWVYHKKSGGTSVEDPGRDELIWEDAGNGKRRPKKEKVRVGDEAVPMFQLRSMAQTRAGAKALRNALAWVVVLAGYKPTPAEELDAPREEPVPVIQIGGAIQEHKEEQEDRDIMLGQMKGLADSLGLKAPARAALLEKHGIRDPRACDITAIQDLLVDLRGMRKANG